MILHLKFDVNPFDDTTVNSCKVVKGISTKYSTNTNTQPTCTWNSSDKLIEITGFNILSSDSTVLLDTSNLAADPTTTSKLTVTLYNSAAMKTAGLKTISGDITVTPFTYETGLTAVTTGITVNKVELVQKDGTSSTF